MDEFAASTSSVGRSGDSTVEETEMVLPSVNPSSDILVKKRLMQAVEYLREFTKSRDDLIQIWLPVTIDGEYMLTTKSQPFSVNPNVKSLYDYRDASRNFHFATEENSKRLMGLPGRVFCKKLPEWIPDVRCLRIEEYHRLHHAIEFNIGGSIALPIFQGGTGNCYGVVEIVTTSLQANFHPEIENVSRALEAVDLRCSKILGPPRVRAWHEHYDAVLFDIQQVLRAVCNTHGLPLAQAWAPCIQQGKGGRRHSDENYTYCISTVDSVCYVSDPRFLIFHNACSEHHLFKGQGIAGKAFTTNQPCFSNDVTAFSETDYPLAHHARRCGLLRAAVAICLRSIYTGLADFVLEFFLPFNCTKEEDQKLMLTSLSSVVQNTCRTLRVVMDDELAAEETINHHHQTSETPLSTTSSWLPGTMEAQITGNEKETEQESKITELKSHSTEEDLQQFTHNNFKRRKKSEKTISLAVLRQHFAGSLKDAAKSMGVCPTTLKRICREHGITRWPSRKIKKVSHSLQKLQLVMDSVNPGITSSAIKIDSFYNSDKQQQHPVTNSPPPTTSSSNSQTTSVTLNTGCYYSSSSSLEGINNNGVSLVIKVKARYKEESIRFAMKEKWRYEDLIKEIGKRFEIEDTSRMGVKYLDDDSEWVLLTCDDDLEECLDIQRCCSKAGRITIKLSVHVHDQPFHR